MKKGILAVIVTIAFLIVTVWAVRSTRVWDGVDETVVGKYARSAGRPPREPFINTDRGDLLLFMFLLAGVGGGFIGGYYFRELFPPKARETRL